MLRLILSAFAVVALCAAALPAADNKDNKDKTNAAAKTADNKDKQQKATITKVDPKNGSVTVKMKDKSGKEVERTFRLQEDIRYFDSTGRVAALDVFRSGDQVLVVEAEGRLKELHKGTQQKSGEKTPTKQK